MAVASGMAERVARARSQHLKITEIFYSLQGESSLAGWPTVFVRLTGCPLRCQYCDTAYAFTGGEWMHFDEILERVAEHRAQHVCVTGGEPLAQTRCLQLLIQLCDAGYTVSLETSGAIAVDEVEPRVIKVLDLKTPDSGEQHRNLWQNLEHLSERDQIKFVICSRTDFDWAVEQLRQRDLDGICPVFFSPSHQQIKPHELAGWILEEHLPVRMQMQMHKQIWGDQPGR